MVYVSLLVGVRLTMSESVFRREKESGASPAAPSTGLVERHLSGALGDNVKSDTEIDLEDDHAPSHNRLVERMQGYLSSLGLSQFSSGVALGYLQSRLPCSEMLSVADTPPLHLFWWTGSAYNWTSIACRPML